MPVHLFRERRREIIQLLDFFAVDLVNDAGAVGSQIGVRRIRQNVRQNDDFGMLEVNLFDDEVIEEMPDWAMSLRAIGPLR